VREGMAGEKILVVEDEAIVAQDISGRLELMGYKVMGIASNADDAIARAGELCPDLVLMDIRLEGKSDGIAAAGAIRKELDIPSIFLTAYADEETIRKAATAEPFGYLVKPFHDRELHASIETAIYRHRTEKALRASETRFRALFQLAPDAILLADLEGRVSILNTAAESLFGKPGGEAVGKNIVELLPPEESQKCGTFLSELRMNGILRGMELAVLSRSGEAVWVEVSASVMLDETGRKTGVVAIFRDIADRKRAHREMLGRLMTHELEEGNLYLVKEVAPVLSRECFMELVRAGYRGAVLSRDPPKATPLDEGPHIEHRWLSAEGGDGSMRPDPGSLCRWVESLGRNQAIFIDRLDYIMSENDIAKSLQFMHRLREIAYLKGHVIILSLDPGTLGPTELRGFEKDALEIQTRTSTGLPGDMMETLKYVYQQNVVGVKPTMTGLCTDLRLSRPTARKRIRMLVRTGHLLLSARGRTKVLELTEKGRRAFPG